MGDSATTPGGEDLLYEAPDGQVRVDVRLEQETVWLTQEQLSQLFGRERSVITKHVRNVFREGELKSGSVCAKFAHTAADGKTYQVDHYNLDLIISVGYRVKSQRGVQFRQWATKVLREHLIQGYTFNQTRLAERGLHEAGGYTRQYRADDVRRVVVSLTRRESGSSALLYCQRSSLHRRQQTHRLFFVHTLPQAGGCDVTHRLTPEGLTALTLLLAESAPSNKDLMIRLIINLLVEPET
jgi:hypothetical protein